MADLDYLESIITNSTEVVQESLFIKRYLPLLFHEDPGAFNLSWLNEVSKNPHARAYVINAQNEILFSVPPLRPSPVNATNDNIVQVLNYIRLESNMNGVHGDALLSLHLPKLISLADNTTSEFSDEWRAILARYGYISTELPVEEVLLRDEITTMTDSDDGW